MKTIAFSKQQAPSRSGGLFRGIFVLAALGGLYYFRRQGGSISGLISKGTEGLNTARNWVNSAAPSVSKDAVKSVASSAQI